MDGSPGERAKRTKKHIKEDPVKCPEETFNMKKTRNVAIKRA